MGLLQKATNQQAFGKLGLLGFPGAGKSYTSSEIAIGICRLVGANSVAFFDTETGSDFLIKRFRDAGIELYVTKSRAFSDLLQWFKECRTEMVQVGIIDSITHVWRELCDSYDRKLNRRGRLQFQDWAVIKKEWARYTDEYINTQQHTIVCGRAGYEYDYSFNEDGSKDLIKTATRMKVESEFAFEPSLVIEMERVDPQGDEVRKLRGTQRQTFKPRAGSQWIHRAHVLKDRTDTLNGQQFDNPTFESFAPHFAALNIGGPHLGVDTSRNSDDRFHYEGKPDWKYEDEQKTIRAEEIQGEIVRYYPGQSAGEKRAKSELLRVVFGTTSWTAITAMRSMELADGLDRIRVILNNPANVDALMNGDPVTTIPSMPEPAPEPTTDTAPAMSDEDRASTIALIKSAAKDKGVTNKPRFKAAFGVEVDALETMDDEGLAALMTAVNEWEAK